jgi:ornithine cyclodeaminase/alanine dehydrogenase-like protein (mu-crystallin family)
VSEQPVWLDPAALPMAAAIDAIERALRDGLDPEADQPRTAVEAPHGGQILLMPSFHSAYAGVKLASVAPGNPARGLPRIQGVYALFEADTLTPVALMDAAALTALRTPAVSAVAARHLAAPGATRLVVFGKGPQAAGHVSAMRTALPIEHVEIVGRGEDPSAVRDADVICCCTSAREPLFDSDLVPDRATVIAIGSHEPGARELDERLMARATVVVESRATALREAGDVIQAVEVGALDHGKLITIDQLIRDPRPAIPPDRPRVFKSSGMSWEDLVVAAALCEHPSARPPDS